MSDPLPIRPQAEKRRVVGSQHSKAFTLIELMIVMVIVGIVMAIGVPAFVKIWRQDALRKSVAEIQAVCSNARAFAILRGHVTEVVFHAKDGRFEVVSGAQSGEGTSGPVPTNPSASEGLSGQFPEEVAVAKLSINGVSCMESEIAKVRFYPNGTCDDLRLVILRPDTREARGIFLEVTTGLADLETDPNKLADEVR
jgi:prepilin-type N-terminal cleavage/methylation domain-containing protein